VPKPGTVSGKVEIFAAMVLTCFEDSREIADTNKDPSTTRSTNLMLARLTSTDENEAAAGREEDVGALGLMLTCRHRYRNHGLGLSWTN